MTPRIHFRYGCDRVTYRYMHYTYTMDTLRYDSGLGGRDVTTGTDYVSRPLLLRMNYERERGGEA